ncbi:Na+/H+ antiporter subunit E [Rubrimonas cliftonensis]|uniref:Multisubunit potassium/proton antiporter, PhaE subunit n=1 Tax=Rubrimonas cliftonensis TaxID=89524 RepID=A0A1H3WLC9_9RHOB|nr:Na+/H+ antiporter subunit E [Rubrimonas cliftonensis]SDZ87966.1 multisubunit potassium/proton antiporter, PhaE subunit [Rubrimonas cliftonensis]
MTDRLFPHPRLSVTLMLVWMMLVNEVSLGALVLGAALGVVVPLLTAPYWPGRPRLTRGWGLAGFVALVLRDVVAANIAVARLIIFHTNASLRPAFFAVPLELRQPEAITLLAGAITMTPGTVSCDLSADGRSLLVHVLDAPDPDAVRDEIKLRYEKRLMEIFP